MYMPTIQQKNWLSFFVESISVQFFLERTITHTHNLFSSLKWNILLIYLQKLIYLK